MALIFADGFDAYGTSNINQRYATVTGTVGLGSPGRLGYGQYLSCSGGQGPVATFGAPNTTLTVGFALYCAQTYLPSFSTNGGFYFLDALTNPLGSIQVGPLGQIGYTIGASVTPTFSSVAGLVFAQTWCYIEATITFSASSSGSLTIRFNGQTVLSQSSVITAANGNGCSGTQLYGAGGGGSLYYDDFYILNSTAPNNAFLGDVKILPLYPVGNGRISGFSRFGGSASGNYTAVQEHPPDGDSSYVYTATTGTSDAYAITTLSNVTTVKAVQVSAFARKDDTPSRVLALGVGNGTSENYDSGHSLNTTYTYVTRQMDVNPLTSAAWSPSDFTTLQVAQQLLS